MSNFEAAKSGAWTGDAFLRTAKGPVVSGPVPQMKYQARHDASRRSVMRRSSMPANGASREAQ